MRLYKKFNLPYIFIIIVLTGISVGIFYFWQNKSLRKNIVKDSKSEDIVTKPEDAKPQIKSNYTITNIDLKWDLLESNDFNFSINFPKGSPIQKGGGFQKDHPEKEISQLTINVSEKLANEVVVMNTGFRNSKSVLEIAQEDRRNTGPANFKYTEIKERTINNANGYEFYGTTKNGTHSYHFFVENGERYINLWYYYPWNGRDLTYNEESIAKEMVTSFKLLR
ncbi:MAG TPA: hypothetical protein VI819_01315 [Patescibacteria group bacterium]|nr:hypothetical protein [Patescibacteria group bacterium]